MHLALECTLLYSSDVDYSSDGSQDSEYSVTTTRKLLRQYKKIVAIYKAREEHAGEDPAPCY